MSKSYEEIAKRINNNLTEKYEAASISFGLNIDSDNFNPDKELEGLRIAKKALDWAKSAVSEELLKL